MAVGVLGINYLNNQIARQRAKSLIKNIEEYKVDNGEYPLTLEALVPNYIESVPASKYTLRNNSFKFINNNGKASLLYVHLPPYDRPTYSFNNKKWTYID